MQTVQSSEAQIGAGEASPGLASDSVNEGVRAAGRPARLPLSMLIAYGVGGTAENVVGFGIGSLLLFYLTVVCGLPGSAAGFAMGLAVVVDSPIQPLVGYLSDNSRSRHGRRHPFMVAGAIPFALGLGLLYAVPGQLSGFSLFAFVLAALLVIRVAQAVFNVPYMALGAELTHDYHERSSVVASRLLCGSLGTALATYLAFGVFMKGHGGQLNRSAYGPFAWSCVAIAAVGVGLTIMGTLKTWASLDRAAPDQRTSLTLFVVELARLVRNPSFRVLFLMALVFQVAWSAAASLGLHANTYFWRLPTEQILTVNLVGVLGYLAGCAVAVVSRRSIQKRTVSMLGMVLIAACQLTLVPLRLAGLIPDNVAFGAVALAGFLSQVGLALTLVGYQSMMADAADEHEQLFGARRQGLYYAGTSLAAFASSGIGAFIAGVALDLIGYPHGAAATKAAIPVETLHRLGLVQGPAMGVITIVSIAILFGYRIGKDELAVIRGALNERRA